MTKIEFFREAKAPFAVRYGNFIGGKFVEPAAGPLLREPLADKRPAALRDRPLRRRPTSRRRSTPPTPPRTPGAAPAPPSGR